MIIPQTIIVPTQSTIVASLPHPSNIQCTLIKIVTPNNF